MFTHYEKKANVQNKSSFAKFSEGSAATLIVKRSAVVAPDVNLKNPLNAGDEAHKHSGFKILDRLHQKSKPWVSVVHKKGFICPPKFKMFCEIR